MPKGCRYQWHRQADKIDFMEKVRIAIVGLNFGRYILDQICTGSGRDHLELAGVCDLDAAKVRQYAAQTGTRAYRDLAEVLADPTLPAVGLFTPPVGRSKLIRQAICAGKHVLTTKPFELDARAAADVLAEARRLNRAVHLNSPAPTLPADLAQIKQWQQQYQLGRPIGCRADVWANYRESADGSWYDDPQRCPVAPVFRLGIYLINDTGRPTPDNAQLSIRFQAGGLANVFASFCVNDGDQYRNSLVLNFENGTIYRNCGPARPAGGAAELSLIMATAGKRRLVEQVNLDETSGDYQWAVFAKVVRGETLPHETSADQIVAGIQVITAMARAEQSGATEVVQ